MHSSPRDIESLRSCIDKRKHSEKPKRDLKSFIPLNTYQKFHINCHTSSITMDVLIEEARQTKYFSLLIYNGEISTSKYLCIDFMQATSSTLVHIEFFQESSAAYEKIQELITVIFSPSNIIYTWGDLTDDLRAFKTYGVCSDDQIVTNGLVNVQGLFKDWYKTIFNQHEYCHQMIDFLQFNATIGSCFYCHCKLASEKWPLLWATMVTFHENFTTTNDCSSQCLAITKLSTVIREQWNREKILSISTAH